MRNLFLRLCTAVLATLMTFAVCAAANRGEGDMKAVDMAIGGITLFSTKDYVQSIYGEPDDISYSWNDVYGNVQTSIYGNSFFITFSGNQVIEIKTTANNGIKTPRGFTVGMPLSKVNFDTDDVVVPYYVGEENGNQFKRFRVDYVRYMKFQGNRKGNIDYIHIYLKS